MRKEIVRVIGEENWGWEKEWKGDGRKNRYGRKLKSEQCEKEKREKNIGENEVCLKEKET